MMLHLTLSAEACPSRLSLEPVWTSLAPGSQDQNATYIS